MTKEKVKSLTKYLQLLHDKASVGTTEKHKNHPKTYERFLKNEIETVKKQLDEAKLLGVK